MFRELFDAAPDAMIAIDRDGNIVRANQQAVTLFGYSGAELTGAAIEILVPEHARTRHKWYRNGFIANPRVRPMGIGQELSALRKNGEEFPVEISLSPLNALDDQVFVASIRDVSDTHRALQALARARYDGYLIQIGRLAQSTPDLGAVMEHTAELIADALAVPGVAIAMRHAQSGALQVRAAHGPMPDAFAEMLEAVDASGIAGPTEPAESPASIDAPTVGFSHFNQAWLMRDGFGGAVTASLYDGNEPVGIVAALSREPRNFAHNAVNFLQSVATLLSAAIQRIRLEEQLSHAQRLEAIGQLTGGIAHDFNNLLTVISGNLEILDSELVERPRLRDMIGNALRAVGRGSDLTRKLLAFARRQRLTPTACDPRRLLGELGSMLERTLGETIELDISCPDDIPHVLADSGQLEAALVNLALNSRDAMPRGGCLSIAVDHHRRDARADGELTPGDYVVFTVRDTGFGMPEDILARAFEPFFTTKETGKGSGLGLSMVYGFVKQSGGHLKVQSELGYGTSIEFHMPTATAIVEEPARSVATPNLHAGETILVVEDDPDVRMIAVAFLRSGGYVVRAAESAETALAQLVSEPAITLIFADVVLGIGMNGLELAREAQHRRPGIPVCLASGYEGAMVDDHDENPVAFELLRKPYRREELLSAVRRGLDSSHLARALLTHQSILPQPSPGV